MNIPTMYQVWFWYKKGVKVLGRVRFKVQIFDHGYHYQKGRKTYLIFYLNQYEIFKMKYGGKKLPGNYYTLAFRLLEIVK